MILNSHLDIRPVGPIRNLQKSQVIYQMYQTVDHYTYIILPIEIIKCIVIILSFYFYHNIFIIIKIQVDKSFK